MAVMAFGLVIAAMFLAGPVCALCLYYLEGRADRRWNRPDPNAPPGSGAWALSIQYRHLASEHFAAATGDEDR